MNIEKMLAYQAVDLIIYRAETGYQNCDEYKKYSEIVAHSNAIKNKILKLDKEAGELFVEAEKLEIALKEAMSKLEKTNFPFAQIKNLEEVDNIESSIKKLSDDANVIERDLNRVFKRLSDIFREVQMLMKQRDADNVAFAKAKRALEIKRKELLESIKDKFNEREALKAQLSEEEITVYEKLRKSVKMPVIAQYIDGNCTRCGMDISAEVGHKLQKSGDYAECTYCRRLVYLK